MPNLLLPHRMARHFGDGEVDLHEALAGFGIMAYCGTDESRKSSRR